MSDLRARNYFVYINDRKHIWRFVYFARRATSGEHAIEMAWAEARATGQPIIEGYMAVPADEITTREAPEGRISAAYDEN
jgi:hypothetical protein